MEARNQRSLTKPRLFWRATGNGWPVYVPAGVFAVVIIIGLICGRPPSQWLGYVLLFFPCYVGICMAVCLRFMVRGFRLLRRQEKELGFRFRQDAASVPVKRLEALDDRWFIAWDGGWVLAVRRDFVKRIDHFKQIRTGKAPLYAIRLTDYQDRVFQLEGSSRSLRLLQQWFDTNSRLNPN